MPPSVRTSASVFSSSHAQHFDDKMLRSICNQIFFIPQNRWGFNSNLIFCPSPPPRLQMPLINYFHQKFCQFLFFLRTCLWRYRAFGLPLQSPHRSNIRVFNDSLTSSSNTETTSRWTYTAALATSDRLVGICFWIYRQWSCSEKYWISRW